MLKTLRLDKGCMLRQRYQIPVQMETIKSGRNVGADKTPCSHLLSSLATSVLVR